MIITCRFLYYGIVAMIIMSYCPLSKPLVHILVFMQIFYIFSSFGLFEASIINAFACTAEEHPGVWVNMTKQFLGARE